MATGLSCRDLAKSYGARTLFRDLSFELPRGAILGVSGQNGVGKSTLLKGLAAILPLDRGQVFFDGKSLGSPAYRNSLAYVPQEVAVDTRLTVAENVALFCDLLPLPRRGMAAAYREALADPLIAEFLACPLAYCSGGMKRRLNLLLGLLRKPDLLLLDEALAGADATSSALILQRLRELAAAGTSILFVSHQVTELQDLGGELLELRSPSI